MTDVDPETAKLMTALADAHEVADKALAPFAVAHVVTVCILANGQVLLAGDASTQGEVAMHDVLCRAHSVVALSAAIVAAECPSGEVV